MTDLRGDGAHHLSLSKAVPLLFTELAAERVNVVGNYSPRVGA